MPQTLDFFPIIAHNIYVPKVVRHKWTRAIPPVRKNKSGVSLELAPFILFTLKEVLKSCPRTNSSVF